MPGDLRLPKRPFRVVANPPFSSGAELRRLVAPGSRLVRADVIVPWHTARRWVSGSGPGSNRWAYTFRGQARTPVASFGLQATTTEPRCHLDNHTQAIGPLSAPCTCLERNRDVQWARYSYLGLRLN